MRKFNDGDVIVNPKGLGTVKVESFDTKDGMYILITATNSRIRAYQMGVESGFVLAGPLQEFCYYNTLNLSTSPILVSQTVIGAQFKVGDVVKSIPSIAPIIYTMKVVSFDSFVNEYRAEQKTGRIVTVHGIDADKYWILADPTEVAAFHQARAANMANNSSHGGYPNNPNNIAPSNPFQTTQPSKFAIGDHIREDSTNMVYEIEDIDYSYAITPYYALVTSDMIHSDVAEFVIGAHFSAATAQEKANFIQERTNYWAALNFSSGPQSPYGSGNGAYTPTKPGTYAYVTGGGSGGEGKTEILEFLDSSPDPKNHHGHEIVENQALGKTFKVCRTCKVEV